MFQKIRVRFFFICFSLFAINVWAQNEITYESISSCITLVPTLSVEQAREKAIQEVKVKALQESGISELITNDQYLAVSISDNNNNEKYYESTFSEIRGEISSFTLNNFTQTIGEGGEILICADANVSIIKYDDYERNGPKVEVSGIRNRYKSLELLDFTVRANKDGYIWIFLVDNNENYTLLFPENPKQMNVIFKDKSISLPNEEVYWQLNTNEIIEEKNSILIVVSDENIPISSATITNFNNWATWYKKLDYRKKNKYIFNFTIYNP